jgi:hypothetical protein
MKSKYRVWIQVLSTVICCVVLSAVSYGQGLDKGHLEATGQIGLAAGIGTHGSIGGSVAGAVTDRIIALGELTYIPRGGGDVEALGFSSSASSKSYTFNVGAQYQIKKARQISPYAGIGLGFLHSSSSFTSSIGPVDVSTSDTDFYVNFGGGARYYMKNNRWGFKPELMIFAGPSTFVRLGAGIFYQFGKF